MRSFIEKTEIQWTTGRLWGISEKELLLAYLCKYEERYNEISILLEGEKISEEQMRSVWGREKSSCSSYRSELQKQQSQQFTNPLYSLSQILARHSRETWTKYCRENAISGYWDKEPDIPRVASGIKDRVNRLKGLGNAIVPQVAFEIFKAIEQLNQTL